MVQSICVKRRSLLSLHLARTLVSLLSFKGKQFSFPVFSLRKIHQMSKFEEIWWLTHERVWNLAFLPIFNFYKPNTYNFILVQFSNLSLWLNFVGSNQIHLKSYLRPWTTYIRIHGLGHNNKIECMYIDCDYIFSFCLFRGIISDNY